MKVLIKDHKPMEDGKYKLRLFIPEKDFSACFSQMGYKGLKKLLDDSDTNHEKFMIKQSVDLKQILQNKNIQKLINSRFSIDVVNMYPPIKYLLIKKAVRYYTQTFVDG